MKFLADENVPLDVVLKLKQKDIDIAPLSETKPGLEDEEVLSAANKERRVLITFDKDFGEIIFRSKKENSGVILLKIHPQTADYITFVLEKVLHMNINFERCFCVVEVDRVRVIPLK